MKGQRCHNATELGTATATATTYNFIIDRPGETKKYVYVNLYHCKINCILDSLFRVTFYSR